MQYQSFRWHRKWRRLTRVLLIRLFWLFSHLLHIYVLHRTLRIRLCTATWIRRPKFSLIHVLNTSILDLTDFANELSEKYHVSQGAIRSIYLSVYASPSITPSITCVFSTQALSIHPNTLHQFSAKANKMRKNWQRFHK